MPWCSAYNSSKAALNQFAKWVALEEAANGIKVNVVSPGCIVVEKSPARFGMDPNNEQE